ncbi:TfoX/Sxy family protein [Mucilaginibacter sp. ZT4R22]|uniref:TfoX/Sxy family protein n=1 Tax=Mucilaginibacter pankratovii TaxID=2772110 RepID=A0ABR7WZV4_9SPHI|nr:TfoX/Sxy family protein [Mucilaginibacter pankratovii]MBD1366979.1 TfoX/Sxy family protein [Mucilaginibacter pankratovii]
MDENLLNRVREALVDVSPIAEKRMFGGVCFMVDDKLCICVNSHEMLCRINPDEFEAALEMDGVRPMEQRARTAKGYVFVHEDVLGNKKDFDAWVNKALAYNKIAKASKKRSKLQ